MRDNLWLEHQLKLLLRKYFANVKIGNPIEIKFGREARYRFGSIKLVSDKGNRRAGGDKGRRIFPILGKGPQKSLITITSMFRDESIPVGVVHYTLAHELCHYAHGFSSTNKKMFKHPHHGGIINKELTARGAQDLIPIFKKWLKEYRKQILETRTIFRKN